MTWLYVLLGSLLGVSFLLFSKVKVGATYKDSLRLKISYLFISFDIPSEKKREKHKGKEKRPKKEKPKKEKTKKEDSFFSKHGTAGLLEILTEVLTYVNKNFRRLSHLVISDLSIDFRVGSASASTTAIKYGVVCSVVYPLVSGILGVCKHKKYTVSVTPDFDLKKSKAYAYALFSVRLFFLLDLALRVGLNSIRLYSNIKKGKYYRKEEGAENDNTSN